MVTVVASCFVNEAALGFNRIVLGAFSLFFRYSLDLINSCLIGAPMPCRICKSELEPENNTSICFSCHSKIADIESKVDGL
jgi:hypothetical protein